MRMLKKISKHCKASHQTFVVMGLYNPQMQRELGRALTSYLTLARDYAFMFFMLTISAFKRVTTCYPNINDKTTLKKY